MAHEVWFEVPQRELGRADIKFGVWQDGKKIGTLEVSKGSVCGFEGTAPGAARPVGPTSTTSWRSTGHDGRSDAGRRRKGGNRAARAIECRTTGAKDVSTSRSGLRWPPAGAPPLRTSLRALDQRLVGEQQSISHLLRLKTLTAHLEASEH